MPTYNGKPVLTMGKFDKAREVVRVWMGKNRPGYDMPTSYKPGHEGDMWVLSLEGADDWAVSISNDDSVVWPSGVFAEPVAGWCLGLYPA